MPADFELNPETHVVCTRAWGIVTDDDLLGHLRRMIELFGDGTLDESWAQLADFTGVESFANLSSDAIFGLAQRNPWPPLSKRALVTSSDIAFGLGRMYQMFAGELGEQLRIFRSLSEAQDWIASARTGDE